VYHGIMIGVHRRSMQWPKHIGVYLAIKLYQNTPVNLLVLFCIHI